MNILIGKIGQKIIFNRESKDCDRSNTNGNVGTYLLFKLLIENNKEDTFYIASENDLDTFKTMPFVNVVDVSKCSWQYIDMLRIDAMFILTGLTHFEKNNNIFHIINKVRAPYLLLSDDPRCLDSVANDVRITKMPGGIISQFRGAYNFKGKIYNVHYVPIERASCYQCEIHNDEKETDMIIVSNTSGKEYDRVKIVSELIDGMTGLDIYGRLSEDEKMMLGKDNCKGEVKYTTMQNIFRKASSTLVVPIKKGWVTSKYVEALMNGVLPIFHEDYNTSLLEIKDVIVVHSKQEFRDVFENVVKNDKAKVKELVTLWTNVMIKPFVDGKVLSDILMCYALLCMHRWRRDDGNC